MSQPEEPQFSVTNSGEQLAVGHIRSREYYVAHGDVVLSAKWNLPGCTFSQRIALDVENVDELWMYFRVDKAQLKHHSKVFADMFSLPTPDEMEEYDGAPLVRLPDEGSVVAWLLKFIFSPEELQLGRLDAEHAMYAKNLMDIGAKYEVEGVRLFMMKQLIADWPNDLLYWILQYNERKTALKAMRAVYPLFSGDDCYEHGRWPQRHTPDPVCAIRIALDHNTPSILPAAFYHLCQIDFRSEYTMWEDGGEDSCRFKCEEHLPPVGTYDFYAMDEQLVRWGLIDRDSLYRLGLGKRALQDISLELTSIFSAKDPLCDRGDVCRTARVQLKETHKLLRNSGFRYDFHKPDPLGTLWEWWKEMEDGMTKVDGYTLCLQCKGAVQNEIRNKINEIWDNLPKLFHLDSLELVTS